MIKELWRKLTDRDKKYYERILRIEELCLGKIVTVFSHEDVKTIYVNDKDTKIVFVPKQTAKGDVLEVVALNLPYIILLAPNLKQNGCVKVFLFDARKTKFISINTQFGDYAKKCFLTAAPPPKMPTFPPLSFPPPPLNL